MASTYTHYVFARDVLNTLPDNLQETINTYRELYDIGCHGSDLLFYYYPLKKTALRSYGYDLHEIKAIPFFEHCVQVVKDSNNDGDMLSYALGFVTHFALDTCVHGYVERTAQAHPDKDFTHGTLEVEFDRYLLVREGKNPIRSSVVTHIVSSKKNAKAIAPFYSLASEKDINIALKSMIFFNNVFCAPSVFKRKMVYFILKLFGKYEAFSSQIFSMDGDERCIETNAEMERRYNEALPIAVMLIENFMEALTKGTPLCERFNRTFSWQDN